MPNGYGRTLQRLPIVVYPVSEGRVLAAARVKATHRVSYADAFSMKRNHLRQ